jgi:hypothetical protein
MKMWIWRNEILHKKSMQINAEIDITRRGNCTNKQQYQKVGIYKILCKNKWEIIRKHESKV